MLFTDDTRGSLEFAAALANTAPSAAAGMSEQLASNADLVLLLDEWGYSGRRDGDGVELRAVRDARARIRTLWSLDRDAAVDEVNAILAEAQAVPRLVKHDDLDWHIHAVDLDEPLGERILVEAAMGVVDAIRSDQMDRLRVCEADGCERVYVDLSKNGSKRYCSLRCGNRMAGRAHRSRAGQAAARAEAPA